MKKLTLTCAAVTLAAIAVTVYAAAPTVSSYTAPNLVAEINTGFATLYGSISTNTSTATVTVGALTASGAVTGGSVSTTGAVGIAEGQLTDSTVLSADIKNGEIVNADVNASAAIDVTKLGTGGVIPVNSAASLTNIPSANLTGNIELARMASAVPAFASGSFYVIDTTNLVFIAGAVTNVIDADITTP